MKHERKPLPASPPPEGLETRRKVFCAHYEKCLDEAIEKDWPGFLCSACQAFVPAKRCDEDWFGDSSACADLICMVFGLDAVGVCEAELPELRFERFTHIRLGPTTKQGGRETNDHGNEGETL